MILTIAGLFVVKIIDISNILSVTVTVVTVKIMTIMTNDSYVFGIPNKITI